MDDTDLVKAMALGFATGALGVMFCGICYGMVAGIKYFARE